MDGGNFLEPALKDWDKEDLCSMFSSKDSEVLGLHSVLEDDSGFSNVVGVEVHNFIDSFYLFVEVEMAEFRHGGWT